MKKRMIVILFVLLISTLIIVSINSKYVGATGLDSDGDGVMDDYDLCPDTIIPEVTVPSETLGVGRFVLIDYDTVFDTVAPEGKWLRKPFVISDTRGCSCEQILELTPGNKKDYEKFGCSIAVIEHFIVGNVPFSEVELVTIELGSRVPPIPYATLISKSITSLDDSLIWDKTYGSPNNFDYGFSFIKTSEGDYVLSGSTNISGLVYQRECLLIKTDSNGNHVWNKTYAEGTVYGCSVIQNSDDSYTLFGTHFDFTNYYTPYIIKISTNGDHEWNKTYDSGNVLPNHLCFSGVQTNDGGYAIFCYKNLGVENDDYTIIKTNSNGNLQWSKSYDFLGKYDWCYSGIQTSDGGYALFGRAVDSAIWKWTYWLVKTDSNGNHEWNASFGGSGNDFGYTVIQTSDGGYLLHGATDSFGVGGYDWLVIKVDGNGNHEWNKTFGEVGDEWTDYGYGAIQASDGTYILTGRTGGDVWLMKLDHNGNLIWDATYSTPYWDEGRSVVELLDGYAVGGFTDYFNGDRDFLLVKLSPPVVTPLQITDIIPIQVVKDVDLVKDKTGIVRIVIESSESGVKAKIRLFFEGELVEPEKEVELNKGSNNVDFIFKPDKSGTNLKLRAEVEET